MKNKGKTVEVHYKGTLETGETFDSSYERGEPIKFTIGEGQVLPLFEEAAGMLDIGGKKTLNIKAKDAYGEIMEDAIIDVPKAAFPPDFKVEVGKVVQGKTPEGQPLTAKIVGEKDEHVTLDHNHPLAGKDLTFEIELVSAV